MTLPSPVAGLLISTVLLTFPLAAQMPAANALPTATRTAPPAGFTSAIALWPGAAPLAHGTTEGDIPKLFTYPAAGADPHPAVIVMPGGGYTHLVIEQEGAYEARWLAAHGVTAFVLEYRLSPAYLYPAPMLDGSRAVRYVRSHLAELGITPGQVGIWGFSAGGHLAGYLSTIHTPGDPSAADPIERVSDRPDFAIISYGRLDLGVPLATGGPQMEAVLGPAAAASAVDAIDPVKHVAADTSPTFIYSTTGDKTVDARNASRYYDALKGAGVAAELHIFELGPHGTHMGEGLKPEIKELLITPTLIANWMQLHGWMPTQP